MKLQLAVNVCALPAVMEAELGVTLQLAAPKVTVFEADPPAPPVSVAVPVADSVHVDAEPAFTHALPHVSVSAPPAAVRHEPVSVTVSPVTALVLPAMEQLAAPPPADVQVMVVPLPVQLTDEGRLMVMVDDCASACVPRAKPSAAAAAHSNVRIRIMILSFDFPRT